MEFLEVLEQIYEKQEAVLGEDFTSALEKSATSIQTQKLSPEQGRELISKYCKYVPMLEQNYFEQCTDQFIAFGLNFCDKNLYYQFKKIYSTKFDSIRDDPLNHNELALYICKRILAIDNKKWVLLFLQSRMEQTKTVEKKFMLLEMLAVIGKQIENKEAFYPRILPDILRAVTDGIKKFEKYQSKYKSEELNQHAKLFQENFEGWVIDFLNRFLTIIKNLPEIKNYKKLLSARDLIEVDSYTGQVQYKNAPAQTLINHYVILFYLDILQGVTEALHQQGVFDEKNVTSFLESSKKSFLEIIPGTQELVENFMYQLRYNNFSDTDISSQVTEYTPYLTYNLTGIGFFIKDLFAQKSFQVFYSAEYKLKILLPYIQIFLKKEPSKAELVKNFIEDLASIVDECTIQPQSINNVNYFNVPLSKVIVAMFEPVGSGYEKASQQKFLEGLKKLLALFNKNCLFEIYQDMILDNENLSMSAFIFDMFRKELGESIKTQQTNSFTQYESITNLFSVLVQKLTSSISNLSEKSSILSSSLSTLEFILMRMKNQLTNNTTSENSDHLLNKTRIKQFTETVKLCMTKINERLGQSFDEVTQEKKQIESAPKVDQDEQKQNDSKNELLNIIKFHAQQVEDEITNINNLIKTE
ncbi:hypothetical protein ABPG74_020646 [Tetrahymena malaccensis]